MVLLPNAIFIVRLFVSIRDHHITYISKSYNLVYFLRLLETFILEVCELLFTLSIGKTDWT